MNRSEEDIANFNEFFNQVFGTVKTLLSACHIRNIKRLDEINAAFDVLVILWRYSNFREEMPTDIDFASNLGSLYDSLEIAMEGESISEIADIREELSGLDTSEFRKSANVMDFIYSCMNQEYCWRDDIVASSVDTIWTVVTCEVSPLIVETAMLMFILEETRFSAIQLSEFFVSRFRSRSHAYEVAVQELELRLTQSENSYRN